VEEVPDEHKDKIEFEFHGDNGGIPSYVENNGHRLASKEIFSLLQQNKKQEAEDYLFDNCLFNPKNK